MINSFDEMSKFTFELWVASNAKMISRFLNKLGKGEQMYPAHHLGSFCWTDFKPGEYPQTDDSDQLSEEFFRKILEVYTTLPQSFKDVEPD